MRVMQKHIFAKTPVGLSCSSQHREVFPTVENLAWVNLLALTYFGLAGEPWPLASSTCCSESSQTYLGRRHPSNHGLPPAFIWYLLISSMVTNIILLISLSADTEIYHKNRVFNGWLGGDSKGLFGPERARIAIDKFIGKSAGPNQSDVAPRRGATNAPENPTKTGPIKNSLRRTCSVRPRIHPLLLP